MTVLTQIASFIAEQPEPKQTELRSLHDLIVSLSPASKLWFFDGKDESGRIVSNPTIGYGSYTIHYTNGKSREFFQIGLSANKSGISVHIMGLKDKKYLASKYGSAIGKATVTGYCIKFRKLADIDLDTLCAAILDRVNASAEMIA